MIFYFYGYPHEDENLLRLDFGCPAAHALRAWRALSPMPAGCNYDASEDPGIAWGYQDLPTCFPGIEVLDDLYLWLLIVHSLAWQAPPGSLLVAERRIWDPNRSEFGPSLLPFEKEKRRREIEKQTPQLKESLLAQPEPNLFFSALPTNVFHASVFAIDLLTERLDSAKQLIDVEVSSAKGGLWTPPPRCSQKPHVSEGVQKEPTPAETDIAAPASPTSPQGTQEPNPTPPRRKPRIGREEAEQRVRRHLSDHPGDTIRNVGTATGVSIGQINKLEAWKDDEPNRERFRKGAPRERNTKAGQPYEASSEDDQGKTKENQDLLENFFERKREQRYHL